MYDVFKFISTDDILCRVGLSVDFIFLFNFPKSKCGGKCNPTDKKNRLPQLQKFRVANTIFRDYSLC